MRALAILVIAAVLATLSLVGCEGGFVASSSFVRTSTVTLGSQTTVIIDAPVQVVVTGARRSTDLVYRLEGTMTASTATLAETLASAIEPVLGLDGPEARLSFDNVQPRAGRITEGLLRVWAPDDVDLQVIGRGGPVDVIDVQGDIDVVGATHSRVTGATNSLRVRVDRGNVIAEVASLPGATIELATNAGEVQVLLPPNPSVTVRATANQGLVTVRHPNLPAHPEGTLPYNAVVNGGFAQVVLTSLFGNVLIDAK